MGASVDPEAVVIDLRCIGKGRLQKETILAKAELFERTFGRQLLVDTNVFLDDPRSAVPAAGGG